MKYQKLVSEFEDQMEAVWKAGRGYSLQGGEPGIAQVEKSIPKQLKTDQRPRTV